MKNTHIIDEEISGKKALILLHESLISCLGNRLRKILCQDLLSQNDSVILWAVVQVDRLFRPKFYC